jgi:hypothetical protein
VNGPAWLSELARPAQRVWPSVAVVVGCERFRAVVEAAGVAVECVFLATLGWPGCVFALGSGDESKGVFYVHVSRWRAARATSAGTPEWD